uniref:Uncharacterized protein n=1 Tax=Cucumis melo TaxID=3656 RepID=A0A9I9CBU0_CUCME
MDLLSPSLKDLFNFRSKKHSLKTIPMLADQMIDFLVFFSYHFSVHFSFCPCPYQTICPHNIFFFGTQVADYSTRIIGFVG